MGDVDSVTPLSSCAHITLTMNTESRLSSSLPQSSKRALKYWGERSEKGQRRRVPTNDQPNYYKLPPISAPADIRAEETREHPLHFFSYGVTAVVPLGFKNIPEITI
jgi:hypothetical protein